MKTCIDEILYNKIENFATSSEFNSKISKIFCKLLEN